MSADAGARLVFDGDCAFCTTMASWARTRLPTNVTVVPWQRVDLAPLGLTPHDVQTALYWVSPDGTTYRGHLGVARALRAFGGWWVVLGWLGRTPPTAWLAQGLYVLVARNRHRLPGGTPACRLEDRAREP